MQVDKDTGEVFKEHILYFNGGINEEVVEYSHGIRQTVMKMFSDTPSKSQDLQIHSFQAWLHFQTYAFHYQGSL